MAAGDVGVTTDPLPASSECVRRVVWWSRLTCSFSTPRATPHTLPLLCTDTHVDASPQVLPCRFHIRFTERIKAVCDSNVGAVTPSTAGTAGVVDGTDAVGLAPVDEDTEPPPPSLSPSLFNMKTCLRTVRCFPFAVSVVVLSVLILFDFWSCCYIWS